MPEESEKREITRQVITVIEQDYCQDFLEIYGTAISVVEIHPEQTNNEIRNALTHLGRALACESVAEAQGNIEKARGHIERGKRDCLKLAIIAKRDQIASAVFRIETVEGAIPRAIKQRLRQIEMKRRVTFRSESNGDEHVSAPLEEILADALELEEQLLGQFTVPGKGSTAIYRFVRRSMRVIFAGSFAILCSIVAAYLFAVVLPEGSPILNTSRSFWSAIMAPVLGTGASGPTQPPAPARP